MNILVSSNNQYLKPLITALYSLSLNTNNNTINVYFINVTVDKEHLLWFKNKISKIKKINLTILSNDSDILFSLKLKNHFSVETYARLLLLKLLPKEIDRILWLDADTIIHNNIDNLYNKSLNEVPIIACKSINQNDMEVRNNLKIPNEQLYFNAGIILFNLKYLRENYNDEFLIQYAVKNNGKLKWIDQDVLNACLGSKANIIDYKIYNYMHFNETKFSKEEKRFIKTENCILHYIGAIKPWDYKYNCYTLKLWQKYAKKSGAYSRFFFIKKLAISFIYKIKSLLKFIKGAKNAK